MYIETFAQKLTKARKDAGYTQETAAGLMGINRNTLASYETGRNEPKIEMLGILADFYSVSLDWLVGTKGTNRIDD